MRVQKIIKYEPGQVTGDDVAAFLNAHLPDHDGSQRPEFSSGFIGCTRTEARKLADMFIANFDKYKDGSGEFDYSAHGPKV